MTTEHENKLSVSPSRTRYLPALILAAGLISATLASLPGFALGVWRDAAFIALGLAVAILGATLLSPRRAPPAEARLPAVALAGIAEITDYAILALDHGGRICLANRGAEKLFGYSCNDLLGESVARILPDDFLHSGRRGLHAHTAPARLRVVLGTRRDGAQFPIELSVTRHAGEAEAAYTLLLRDATEAVHKDEQLKLSAKVFEGSTEAILITDAQGRVLSANRTFTAITGYGIEEIVARRPWEMASLPHEPAFYETLIATLRDTGHWEGEIWDRNKSGEVLALRGRIRAIRNKDSGVGHYIATFTDVSDIKLSEERLRHITHHDELTGLPNRVSFQERLRLAMGEAHENQRLLAVLFIDLDRFKTINDSLEHSVGDELLKAVGARLRELVRSDDIVARLGGDEFAMVLANLMSEDDAGLVAHKILEHIARPFHIAGHELRLSASIGISLYPADGQDAQTLMKNADTALYRVKERGRNGFGLYTASMNAASFEQLVLENALRKAIERHELEVHYQPKLDFGTGEIRGLEALVRWHHPELGTVSPAQFIPLAEETGLIIGIGTWVLERACVQHCQWIGQGLAPVAIAVNLSPTQFQQPDLAETVGEILRATGMDPHCLELELTESGVMHDAELSSQTLRKLRAMGVTVSIDDFGTGYSSLGYLRRFPISTLKIDRSFVRDVISDPDSAAIIHAIVAMARTMNLRTVAEGVETVEQLEYLHGLRCDEMQGFLFSPPLPADKITALLAQWRGAQEGGLRTALTRLRESRAN
jgi:diguanylate cyclase (GGDEF)-like protein/PAS domain S-box-containing protein